MKKAGVKLCFLILFMTVLIPFISASIEDEIQKLTYYTSEYESGNIDYAKLLVYLSGVRQKLNEELGVIDRDEGGILTQEQIKKVLGEPTEETKWVWNEKEGRDKRVSEPIPVWNKIIFDGRKVQLRLDAYPSLYVKRSDYDEEENGENGDEVGEDENNEENGEDKERELTKQNNINENKENEEKLVYRLNFNIEFKKPEEQLDVNSKIDEVKLLAENFNSNSIKENAEALAEQSVNAEKAFESYFEQSSLMCSDIMNNIFGSESKKKSETLVVKEVDFFDSENLVVTAHIESCEDCDWNWINFYLNWDTRGALDLSNSNSDSDIYRESYEGLSFEQFKSEARNLVEKSKQEFESGNYKEAFSYGHKFSALTNAWNDKANNVWEEVDKIYASEIENPSNDERYYWIKLEQKKREKEKELRKQNFEDRKKFYAELFTGNKKEYSYEQEEWEKRLIQTFKENKEEICDDNIDNNDNELVDCQEDSCHGKFAGQQKVENVNTNGAGVGKEEIVDLFCIEGERKPKPKEEIEKKEAVCGNHICEIGENEAVNLEGNQNNENSIYCPEDCRVCPEHKSIECNGRLIFSGKDENGCNLQPVCVQEQTCESNDDCNFRCGVGKCVEDNGIGFCQLKELTECREVECIDGDKKEENCNGNELVIEICENDIWKETGVVCETRGEIIEEKKENLGNSCVTIADCGNENDVCSNGICTTLPTITFDEELEKIENILKEESKKIESRELNEAKEAKENFLFGFFKTMKIIGNAITGKGGGDGNGVQDGVCPEIESPLKQEGCITDPVYDEAGCVISYNYYCEEGTEENKENDEEKGEFEDEKRCEWCNDYCQDSIIRDCVEDCVFIEDSNELGDLEQCKTQCENDNDKKQKVDSCVNECSGKCLAGEDFYIEGKHDEYKEEKGVFRVGGMCRVSEGERRKEGFIYFDGWGTFDRVGELKHKYYEYGDDWCKEDLENLLNQRKEFENSFNEEFAKWFFENHLANSADEWESHVSGIYEIYWKNVDNQREIAHRMRCLGRKDITEIYQPNLINFKYDTEFGSIEYWEEIKKVKLSDIDGYGDNDGSNEEIELITPYMQISLFPNKKFIANEMKKAMKNHEFPGPPEERAERENEEGPTEEEREMIKMNKNFMKMIRKISNKYDGSLDASVQLKDYENNEVVFNLYVQVNENVIMKMQPMTVEEMPEKDVTIEIDFDRVYNLIKISERDMRGAEIESPPWDEKPKFVPKIKQVFNGIKIFFEVRGIINDAKIYPQEAEKDVRELIKEFFNMMLKSGFFEDNDEVGKGEIKKSSEGIEGSVEKGFFEPKEVITGEVVRKR